MRSLEFLLLFTLATQVLVVVMGRPHRAAGPLIGLGITVAALQAIFEGARWQLVPAGFLMTILAALLFRLHWRSPDVQRIPMWRRFALGPVLAPILVVAVFLPLIVPVFKLPFPTGPHEIGTTWIYLADSNREELYTKDPNDVRELMVRVWYPASKTEPRSTARYWSDAARRSRVMAGSWGLPSFLFSHFGLVATHSYAESPVAATGERFPVVVYSHGLTEGYPGQNTPLVEELASRGIVVFGVAHTYETLGVEMPDGRYLPFDHAIEESFVADIHRFRPAHQEFLKAHHDQPLPADGLRRLHDLTPVISRSMGVWAADITSVIDEIHRLAATDGTEDLGSIIDPERIAAVGMSFGGAASAQASFENSRIRAVVNLDGFHYGDALLGERVPVPYLLFGSDVGPRWRNQYVLEDGAEGSWVVVDGATHFDFSDFVFFGDVFRWLGAIGPIGEDRMPALISAFTLPFLDAVLSGQPAPPLESLTAQWPEAQVTVYP